MEVETLIGQWATGVRQEPRAGRTMVIDADEWIPALIAGNLLEDSSRVFHREAGGLPTELRGRAETFAGRLLGGDSDLTFGNGLLVRQGHYGGSEFLSVDGPVMLRGSDDDDFSAFLRDADVAWTAGRFSRAVTSPLTLIADLCGLGGPADSGGPGDRIFVAATGVVSTSPTGRRLGVAGEPWELIQQRWDDLNGASRRPCAVCLAGVLDEQDRADALTERPWLSRYLDAIAVIRTIRAGHLEPSQVSGFGGRLNSTLPWGAPDDRRAPILGVLGVQGYLLFRR